MESRSRRGSVRIPAVAVVLTSLLVAGGAPPAAAGPSNVSVRIAAPPPGAEVGGIVTIEALADASVTSVLVDWSRDHGASWTPVGPATRGDAGWSLTWQTTGLSGPILLRAIATDGESTAEASEPITLVNAPSIAMQNSRRWIDPGAEGDRGSTSITVTATASLLADVTVVGADPGQPISTLAMGVAVGEGPTTIVWDGLEGGARVADGAYALDVLAVDPLGARAWSSAAVYVDGRDPRIRWRGIRPEPQRTAGRITFGFRSADPLSPTLTLRLDVEDALGTPSAHLRVRRAPGAGTIGWLPRGPGGRPVVPGGLRARLTATDRAGNVAASPWRTFRILRPVTTHVYRGFTGVGRVAALTFDDCGDEAAWSRILSTLDRMDARAAFFCLGGRITGSPGLARRTAAAGHTIGSHTWSHAYLPGTSPATLASDLSRVEAAWWDVARLTPAPFFRPPYGSYDASNLGVVGSRGYACTTLWSVDPRDWSGIGASVIAARVLSRTMPGGIVLLHTLGETARALPRIIIGLRARGFRLVSLGELFRLGSAHGSTAIRGAGAQLPRLSERP